MDQLQGIRVCVRIAEARSFAKAADSLNLPRSSVSKLLQDLERHLGVKLVERSTRALTITPEGETYREQVLGLLADLDQINAAADSTRASPRGRLRVDVGSSLSTRGAWCRCSKLDAALAPASSRLSGNAESERDAPGIRRLGRRDLRQETPARRRI